MRDRWVGLQAGVDARKWAGLLQRAHTTAVTNGHVAPIVREVIADSWERCSETGVDPDESGAPLAMAPDDAGERFRDHPLAQSTQILRTVLGDLLFDAQHIVVVSDAEGCLLWADGHPDVLKASERIRFTPGHAWSEAAAGTNAVGTALAAGHAVQVFSAEHYRSEVHPWQCSGAPVRDPETGETLGVIDVTGHYETAHPHNLALVQLAARLVEEQLRADMLARDARILELFAQHTARHGGPAAALSPTGRVLGATPAAWRHGRIELDDVRRSSGVETHELGEGTLLRPVRRSRKPRGAPRRLTLLGDERALLAGPDGTTQLTRRHSQIAALLASHEGGLDARALSELLYDEPGHEVSVRGELHRMRELFGDGLATRPYRLTDVEIERPQG